MARAPFGYFGGKYFLLPAILPLLPPHQAWVELFAGAAWTTLARDRAPCELLNDLDHGVTNFYEVVRHPARWRRLQDLLRQTPYAREEYLRSRATWQQARDPVERARRWFVLARQSFAGRLGWGGWSYSVESRLDRSEAASKWLGAIEGLREVHDRLQGVQIECRDFRRVLSFWDRPEVLTYLDPPYPLSTRNQRRGYVHELSDADHADLVARLLTFRGMALVSGYDHPTYRRLDEAGWHRREVPAVAHSAGRTRATRAVARPPERTEILWWNYDLDAARGQLRLFDP